MQRELALELWQLLFALLAPVPPLPPPGELGTEQQPHYPSQGYIAGRTQGPLSPMNLQRSLLSPHLTFPSLLTPAVRPCPHAHGAALTRVTSSFPIVNLSRFTAADVAPPPPHCFGEAQPSSNPPPTPKRPLSLSAALALSPLLQCRPSMICTLNPPFSPCTRSDSFHGCKGPLGGPFPSRHF